MFAWFVSRRARLLESLKKAVGEQGVEGGIGEKGIEGKFLDGNFVEGETQGAVPCPIYPF